MPSDRRAKLEACLAIAREKGNRLLEANLLKALRELEAQERKGAG